MNDLDEQTLHDYVSLFRGRGDVRGGWNGRCIRLPLTAATYRAHLTDGDTFGVYPAFNITNDDEGPVAHCIWGCTDIDYTDDPEQALRLQAVFAAVDVNAHVERTAHGYHIWVFFDTLIPARDVRAMFLAAHQVADIPPTEVNPKQTVLAPGQVGNYVRLPYPNWYSNGPDERYFIDTDAVKMTPEEFTSRAVQTLCTASKAATLASYYKPPPAPSFTVLAPTADMTEAARALTPLGKVIWRDGPLEGNDRSRTLMHFVHECAKAELNPADALMLLKDADQRWGKYSKRGEAGLMELQRLVERAYGPQPST